MVMLGRPAENGTRGSQKETSQLSSPLFPPPMTRLWYSFLASPEKSISPSGFSELYTT